jgi:hypothetical protein
VGHRSPKVLLDPFTQTDEVKFDLGVPSQLGGCWAEWEFARGLLPLPRRCGLSGGSVFGGWSLVPIGLSREVPKLLPRDSQQKTI